ncbi:MAG: cytochrome c3 family protein [Burkholderiales bacterium]|jgi:fumarate reductase flavoprotein subunit|nr:cytochrome c3 family protein [Burkholderiales bacterium]
MKSIYIVFVTLFAALSMSVFAAPMTIPMGKHLEKGVTCAQCHKENPPAKAVPFEKCESCHGNNDAMAKRTEKVEPNPHFNHLGDVTCTECHKNHSESVLICSNCHKFNLKTP